MLNWRSCYAFCLPDFPYSPLDCHGYHRLFKGLLSTIPVDYYLITGRAALADDSDPTTALVSDRWTAFAISDFPWSGCCPRLKDEPQIGPCHTMMGHKDL